MASAGPSVTCKYHPEAVLVEDYRAGDMICSECGIVVGDRVIDVGSEWRTFSNDRNAADMSRVGDAENPLLQGAELSTMIDVDRGASTSYDESGSLKYRNRRTLNSSDRTLLNAFKEIQQMADRLNLPKGIPDRANTMFKQVHDTRALKGRNTDAIAAACLYIACRQEGVARSFKEICAVSRTSKKDIGKTFKHICRHVKIDATFYSTTDFMARFCSLLDLPPNVRKAATVIASRVQEIDEIAGRAPTSLAAAAIYMASQASDCKKTQKEVGDVAGVAEATIKQAYKMMLPHARKLFPDDFHFTVPVEALPSS